MIPTLSVPRRRGGTVGVAVLASAALALLAACDIPTSSPIIDTRWVVPSQGSRIAVSDLLPSGVSILADSSGFAITAAGATVTRTLGQDCAACLAGDGTTIPKPQFTANASATTSLPSGVSSATLTGGTLNVTTTSNYNFDPLRPSATARGYGIYTVTNGASVVGRDSINGATTSLAANGGSVVRPIPLAGPISGSSPLVVTLQLFSPLGDPVNMIASRTLNVVATPTNLKVASANVSVVNRTVNSTSTIDLAGVDQGVSDRVLGGSLLLTVVNPFTVSGTLSVTLTPAGGPSIVKSVPLGIGTTSPKIDFSQSEIRSLLGRVVTLTFSGPVSSTSGAVAVSPRQAVVLTSRFDLSLELGG